MTTARLCPQCDQPLPSDGPQGLCPACLLKAALGAESAPTGLHDPASPTATAPEAGERLKYFGDYELLEEIARGGMGIVWKARQTSLHREVALKMVRAGALASPDEVQRFLREAEAAANLQHPNIVAIHEVGAHGGQHYFSMDYVAGRDLGALVQDGPLAPQRAARYVKIIAEAIHFAHQRGTLHRDLKPQNVLIDAADQPRITDFGLAKIMHDDSRLTQSGVVMGSPSYMPPEQAAGRHGEVGPASDVYALGAMLYELLTGRPPFRGATALATLREVMEAEPVAPRQLRPDLPADLDTICLKCLEKTPAARYPTARALAEELERYLRGEPIQARPASPVRKAVSWGRRHPGTLAALAALAMVALAFAAYYLYEENAFLRYQQANPNLVRPRPGDVIEPGQVVDLARPRHEALEMWQLIDALALGIGIYTWIFLMARVRGVSFRDWPKQAGRSPIQPLGERTRIAALGVGVGLIVCGVMLLAKAIEAHVWEGESLWGHVLGIYASIYFALVIFGFLIRDYRLVHYGPASRQLNPEQLEPIRRAMEDYNVPAAINLYREAVPDAGFMEANEYVLRLAESLRVQYPGKFVPPPLSLARLNWKAMFICAAIEAAVLGALWFALPPTHPASAAAQFAYSFLFGLGVLAGARVKGFWQRLLLLVPALAAMVLSEAFVPLLAESSHAIGSYLCGFFFGACLMVSGFTPRRR